MGYLKAATCLMANKGREIPIDLSESRPLNLTQPLLGQPGATSAAQGYPTGARAAQARPDPLPNIEDFDFTQAAHPIACFFHFIFKAIAIFGYLVLQLLVKQITAVIIIIVAAALDFWITKNITGRLLVGLRWWSEMDEDGNEEWRFETNDQQVSLNPIDKHIFWWCQTVATGFWVIVLVLDAISLAFFWGVVAVVAGILCGTNLFGYYKCSRVSKTRA
eukprot:TRINITY_DN9838_c0_g1_i3.p1 TRINITY_DN9838_c0_g1~~TRINITY_DN9838_c0_g1_i3.p1  ORF type:complete len:219 (+),score=33.78 TRINITY_DN9838_c0_g1_i3:97-753(+)